MTAFQHQVPSSYDTDYYSPIRAQSVFFANGVQKYIAAAGSANASITFAISISSIIVFAIYLVHRKLQAFLPRWLRPFANEKDHYHMKKSRHVWWTISLGFIAIAGLALAIVPIWLRRPNIVAKYEFIPWATAVLITVIERPVKTPRFLLIQYFTMLLAALAACSVSFLNSTLRSMDPFLVARLVLSFVAMILIVNMPLRDPRWDASGIGKSHQPPMVAVRSPEDKLTLLQFWTMTWVYPLAKLCMKRDLAVEDVWQLPFEFQHNRLYLAFGELKGRLIPRLLRANGLDLSISASLAIVEKTSEVSNIRLTSELYSSLDRKDLRGAIFWCLVMLAIDCLRQVAKTTSNWYSRKAYERSRGETFIALFSKLLTRAVPGSDTMEKGPAEDNILAGHSERPRTAMGRFMSRFYRKRKSAESDPLLQSQRASNAKVVNLVRGDTYEISQRFWDFPRLVSQPVKVVFTLYYLIDIMGWPCVVGVGLMFIFLTINSGLVRKMIQLERQRTSLSDKRAQAVAHFVEASRPLKLNGWASTWSDRIMRFRALEMMKRLQISYVTAAVSTVNVLGGAAYPLASICLYTLILRRGLPNEVIWPSLQLFGHLEASVKEAFDLISAYWKATIPVERVNKYMEEPDRDDISTRDKDVKDVIFSGASFSWPSTTHLVLENLNVSFSTGLTVIRGPVGSGKSSLLLAALNEMELHEGELVRPDEPIGYTQQLPWLQNKTIRENILFHQPFDKTRYYEVLDACGLLPDLGQFPSRDQTRLEEDGVGLSGGQRARVALARIIYNPCRIMLLDDPLAALDHGTASRIVHKFLEGPLAEGRIVVMVTHRDDLVLRLANKVIDMDNGRAKVLSQEELETELKHPMHAPADFKEFIQYSDSVSLEAQVADDATKDAPEEPAETGSVSMGVYTKYIKAGGLRLWALLAVFYSLSRVLDISRARLLEAWGNDTAKAPVDAMLLGSFSLPDPELNPSVWLYILGGLSAGQVVSFAVAQALLAHICVNAAQGLFKTAVQKVGKATFRYHDITPTGQLKNRLIADMSMVDGGILTPLEAFVYNFIALVLSLAAITTHQPYLLIILFLVALLFVYFFRIYVPISRCLRRMEMRYLTPIISNIGVMQDGLVTIRAMRAESRFQDRHLEAVDDFQKQDHFFWSMAFWLDFRLSMSSACARAALVLSMVWYGTPASAIGFVLTQTTIAMTAVQQLCEKFAQLQLDAVSLERVDMLNRIPEEPNGEDEPPQDWPRACDTVSFQDMSFKYSEELPPVLHNVSFEIPGGSTCAVLGRTGSGKSTIANALLATEMPSEGTVKIGALDLAHVNRKTLRNRVTFIQQDPILFPGTLRDNVDPENKFSDDECRNAIHRVLGPSWHLDSQIDAAGKNLSQGQRQLVSIGRAVLRRSGLVILDEATASIDRTTAAKVQRILREELASSTVITIAHRLEAVEDANWCLRLDHGRVVECGPARGADLQEGEGSSSSE